MLNFFTIWCSDADIMTSLNVSLIRCRFCNIPIEPPFPNFLLCWWILTSAVIGSHAWGFYRGLFTSAFKCCCSCDLFKAMWPYTGVLVNLQQKMIERNISLIVKNIYYVVIPSGFQNFIDSINDPISSPIHTFRFHYWLSYNYNSLYFTLSL